MKSFPFCSLFVSLLFVFPHATQAQIDEVFSKSDRAIVVQGSASQEIIPNEYYFKVVMTEFIKNKNKTTIETLEKRLLKGLDSIGIAKSQISLDQMSDMQTFHKRRNSEHLTTQKYQIKLTDLEKLKPMLEVLGNTPAQSVVLDRVDHSEMTAYRKEVKIKAIQAGKEKAAYLLEAVGNKPGKLLGVVENEAVTGISEFYMNQNLISNNRYDGYSIQSNAETLTFKTLKLRFTFDLKYEIID